MKINPTRIINYLSLNDSPKMVHRSTDIVLGVGAFALVHIETENVSDEKGKRRKRRENVLYK